MPPLSIFNSGKKRNYTHTGEENEITRILTQCALRDELLAQVITQSALNISQKRISISELQKSNNNPEVSQP
jgi:hypothetical protein